MWTCYNTRSTNNREHLVLSHPHSRATRKENSLNRFAIGGTCICCLENVMAVDKSSRGIAQIAPAPDFFSQLTSLALGQGLTSNLPLSSWAQVYPNNSALQRGQMKRKEREAAVWSFFRGHWLSQALFKMAGIQKSKAVLM